MLAALINTYFYFCPLVGEFILDDYKEKVELFPFNASYGEVSSAKDAKEIAKELWDKHYPDSAYGAPYKIYYDSSNRVWLAHRCSA